MEFRPFAPGIEVNGLTVRAIVDGFRAFKQIPSRILMEEGIGCCDAEGLSQVDPEGWYPQQAWLRVFERITKELRGSNLLAIGMRIPDNARFPRGVVEIHGAMASIDVAYHMNHRKEGLVMLDSATGAMAEGIGHYGYEPVPHERRIVSRCENPYPCEFDRGILTAMARRYESIADVTHDDREPCRRRGAESCTYHVTW
jgi:hypothetical protein